MIATFHSARFYIRRFPNFFDTCLVIRPSITDKCIDAVRWSNSCQLRAAGLSVALAGGASAATGAPAATMLTPNNGASHEITLLEEAIFDVTLATFLVVNKEAAGKFQAARKLAMGGGCGGGCAGCAGWSGAYGASPESESALQQRPSKPPHPSKHTRVPKRP
jgi:hypothetical protein